MAISWSVDSAFQPDDAEARPVVPTPMSATAAAVAMGDAAPDVAVAAPAVPRRPRLRVGCAG